jgi:glutaminase
MNRLASSSWTTVRRNRSMAHILQQDGVAWRLQDDHGCVRLSFRCSTPHSA